MPTTRTRARLASAEAQPAQQSPRVSPSNSDSVPASAKRRRERRQRGSSGAEPAVAASTPTADDDPAPSSAAPSSRPKRRGRPGRAAKRARTPANTPSSQPRDNAEGIVPSPALASEVQADGPDARPSAAQPSDEEGNGVAALGSVLNEAKKPRRGKRLHRGKRGRTPPVAPSASEEDENDDPSPAMKECLEKDTADSSRVAQLDPPVTSILANSARRQIDDRGVVAKSDEPWLAVGRRRPRGATYGKRGRRGGADGEGELQLGPGRRASVGLIGRRATLSPREVTREREMEESANAEEGSEGDDFVGAEGSESAGESEKEGSADGLKSFWKEEKAFWDDVDAVSLEEADEDV